MDLDKGVRNLGEGGYPIYILILNSLEDKIRRYSEYLEDRSSCSKSLWIKPIGLSKLPKSLLITPTPTGRKKKQKINKQTSKQTDKTITTPSLQV